MCKIGKVQCTLILKKLILTLFGCPHKFVYRLSNNLPTLLYDAFAIRIIPHEVLLFFSLRFTDDNVPYFLNFVEFK